MVEISESLTMAVVMIIVAPAVPMSVSMVVIVTIPVAVRWIVIAMVTIRVYPIVVVPVIMSWLAIPVLIMMPIVEMSIIWVSVFEVTAVVTILRSVIKFSIMHF